VLPDLDLLGRVWSETKAVKPKMPVEEEI
jgi:hypothetical protein